MPLFQRLDAFNKLKHILKPNLETVCHIGVFFISRKNWGYKTQVSQSLVGFVYIFFNWTLFFFNMFYCIQLFCIVLYRCLFVLLDPYRCIFSIKIIIIWTKSSILKSALWIDIHKQMRCCHCLKKKVIHVSPSFCPLLIEVSYAMISLF